MVAARKADFNRLAEKFSISPVLARIIVNRGSGPMKNFSSIYMEIWKVSGTGGP